ncbi:MAG: T9SS type A sorting domain-containing protein, partial [Candidatus Azobacteroides sp.]|nr:T9SS type A sorting domain-containing protein [Candidatus Azobacteroides sp.]
FADTWGGPITGYSYMHIKMYCNKAISPHVNVQAGGSEPGPMSGGMVTTTNAWVDVVFNISDCSAVERILIMFDSTDQDSEVYLDDIILSNDPTPITDGMLTKVNNIVGGTDVSVFAVNGTLHISGSSDAVAVYSALGQLVYQNKPAENLSVELAKGLYIVKAGAVIQKILIQ